LGKDFLFLKIGGIVDGKASKKLKKKKIQGDLASDSLGDVRKLI